MIINELFGVDPENFQNYRPEIFATSYIKPTE